MEKLKLRFGLDEISEDIYKTSIAYLNTEFAEIERCLENANKNLSNLDKFVDRAMLMCCQLGGYFQAITKKKNKKRQMILVICRLLSEWGDSNARPLRPERSALPTALHSAVKTVAKIR